MVKRSACLSVALAACLVALASGQADDSSLAPVATLVARHQDAEALAVLAGTQRRESPEGRYLAGRLLERLGRHAEAAEAFGQITKNALPAQIAADAAQRRAFALARAGRCDEAAPELEAENARGGASGALARALLAECALGGDPAAAVTRLRAVVTEAAGSVDLFVARLELAQALEASGDAAGARQELTQALLDRPGHPDRQLALDRLAASGTPYRPVAQRAAPAEPLAVARAALARGDGAATLAALAKAPRARTRAERAERAHLEGMALYGQRTSYAEAAHVLARAASLGGPTAVDDAFHAARARSRAGDNRRAMADYRRLARKHPDHPRAAEATYLAAYLELGEGGPRAARGLERFLASPHATKRPGDAQTARWLVGFHAFEAGRHAEAVRLLARYGADATAPLEVARAAYWRGRSAEAGGTRADAVAAYELALYHEPLGWYAQLAHRRLEGLGEAARPPFAPLEAAPEATPHTPVGPTTPADVAVYRTLGLLEDARSALRGAEDSIREAAPEGRRLEAVLMAYAGLDGTSRPYRLAAVAGGRFPTPPGEADRYLWDAAYPRPYADLVERAAARHGVPVAHVYATMRQESAFDPAARSSAGATGLLQLMPTTAAQVATRLGVPFDPATLTDPAVNIPLGVAEMAALFERWDAHLPLVIAAYNAGSHRVASWVEARGPIETDRFVEHIPYAETRNYVRRVIGHFGRYGYLANPDSPWAVPIPEMVVPEVVPR